MSEKVDRPDCDLSASDRRAAEALGEIHNLV